MKNNGIVILFKLIRWAVKTILIMVGVIPLTRCNSGYKQKDGKLTFNGKELSGKGWRILNASFAVNDSAVYYKERIFQDADPASFKALDEHYGKDRNNVYYCDEYRDGQSYYTTKRQIIVTLHNELPESFEVLEDDYAKDQQLAYCKGIAFKVKDLASLEVINRRFIRDRYKVYFDRRPVANADAKSFHILNTNYASDTNRVYYYGFPNDVHNGIHEIPCKKEGFTFLPYPFSRDNESVYYTYTKIKGSDPASFVVLENGYSKDRFHVYKEEKIVKGADPAVFKVAQEEIE